MSAIADYIESHAPSKPYCTDDLSYGLRINTRKVALTKRYMQINSPTACHCLVFDVDYAGAAFAAQDAGLPDPSAVIITRESRHAHIFYMLDAPVFTCNAAKHHPIRYLASVQRAYTRELCADVGYCGLIAKNPIHTDWLSLYALDAPIRSYTLAELAECVDLSNTAKNDTDANTGGYGRNCAMFDKLRKWAYSAVRRHRGDMRHDSFVLWQTECINKAMTINSNFTTALSFSETRSIAKSVAKFCWKHDAQHEANFRHKQAMRGKQGGKQSGMARLALNEDKRASARLMRVRGMSTRQIGDELGVNQSTVVRWLQK